MNQLDQSYNSIAPKSIINQHEENNSTFRASNGMILANIEPILRKLTIHNSKNVVINFKSIEI